MSTFFLLDWAVHKAFEGRCVWLLFRERMARNCEVVNNTTAVIDWLNTKEADYIFHVDRVDFPVDELMPDFARHRYLITIPEPEMAVLFRMTFPDTRLEDHTLA